MWLLQSPAKRRGKPMASGRCLVMEKGDWTKLPIADFPRPCVISTADVPNKVVQPSTGISQVINHCEYIGTPVLGDDHPTSRRVRGQDDLRAIIVDWTAPNAAICTPQGRTPRVQRGPCCRSGNGMCIQEIDVDPRVQSPESTTESPHPPVSIIIIFRVGLRSVDLDDHRQGGVAGPLMVG